MIPSPQADTFGIPGKREDYSERTTAGGTARFFDGEDVGFHESNLDPVSAIRQEATDLAFSMHPVTQHEVIDGKRIEFGGAIVEATHYANEQPAVVIEAAPVIDTLMIAKFSSAIIALRLSKRFNDTNVSRRT